MSAILIGRDLTLENVIRVARDLEKVEISQSALEKIQCARDYVEKTLESGEVVYGITTGFGKFCDRVISADETKILQKNLIVSHACAMGKLLPREIVRATMLLRANSLSKGHSGARIEVIQTLVEMLNKGVHPLIPEKGSLGASGDLAPLSHMALVLIGEGEAEYRGETMSGKKAMKKAGIPVIELAAKEGLALVNGTQAMTAMACFAVYDALDISKTADIAAALTIQAQLGITRAFDPRVQTLRRQTGQTDCAENLMHLLENSSLAQEKVDGKVQDAYSVRCTPQIHGASRDTIYHVLDIVSREINAVTDNPLIFPDDGEAISAGNFHGQPLALAMDFLGIALAEYASVSERRLERLVNPQLSHGLPAFLAENGGVNSGFMITQYAAAAMASENKVLAHPASVDSIPSSANQEDHVSMGSFAARKALTILDNCQKILGIELFAAAQASDFRGARKLSPATLAVYAHIRENVPFIKEDVIMYEYMTALDSMVKNHEISACAEEVCGRLL